MSKTKTLFTVALLVLLGSMGAAQAQENNIFVTAEMVTQPRPAARMGGTSEMSGSVWLTFSTAAGHRKNDSQAPLLRPAYRCPGRFEWCGVHKRQCYCGGDGRERHERWQWVRRGYRQLQRTPPP